VSNQAKGGRIAPAVLYNSACRCDDGSLEDCVKTAYAYRNQDSPGDAARAALLYERACVWGYSKGCSGLGEMLFNGLVPQKKKALEVIKKCCDFDNAHACGILGIVYEFGNTVTRDLVKAMQLYRKGCEAGNGNPEACRRLSMGYAKGRGVVQDAVKARELLTKACDEGHTDACQELKAARMPELPPTQWMQEVGLQKIDESVKTVLSNAAGGPNVWPLKLKRVRVKTMATYKPDEPRVTIAEIHLHSVRNGLVYRHSKDMDPNTISESIDISLYGFISVLGRSIHEEHRMSHRLVEFSIDTPLQSLRAGSIFSYRTTTIEDSDAKPSSTARFTTCKIGRQSQAAILHPKLPGDAIPLECSTSIGNKPSNRSSGFLLPAVGWYFVRSFETFFGYKSTNELLEVDLY
jgi:hypothetical protein